MDEQTNQTWTTNNTDKVYNISIPKSFHAYRINSSLNGGYSSDSSVGELDFYKEGTTSLSLKRDYEYDMKLDSTWSDTGSLHRKKITREEWVKIDKLNVTMR